MSQLEEMRERVAKLKAMSYVLSPEEEELAKLAREEQTEQARLDTQLAKTLDARADIALMAARAAADEAAKATGKTAPPLAAIWSAEAHNLCGVGWLVLGPEDKGYAALALKASGKLDGSGKYKVQEMDPDVCCAAVVRACVTSPFGDNRPGDANKANRERLSRALTDAPHFVVACYRRIEMLSGSVLQDAAGKSGS